MNTEQVEFNPFPTYFHVLASNPLAKITDEATLESNRILLTYLAITLPAGWSRNGLPLGLQLVGSWQGDLALLRVAKWVEQTLQWQGRPLDQER